MVGSDASFWIDGMFMHASLSPLDPPIQRTFKSQI